MPNYRETTRKGGFSFFTTDILNLMVIGLGILISVLLVAIGLLTEKYTEYKDLKIRLYLLDEETKFYEYSYKKIERNTLNDDKTLKGDFLSSLQKQHLIEKMGSDILAGERLYKKHK